MRMYRIIISAFCFFFLLAAFPGKVSANAMPYTWDGVRGSEMLVAEDCPIQVEGERLLFELDSQKTKYTLGSSVTAVYSLYNLTDAACSVPAVFPVVAARDSEERDSWEVLRNGEPLPFRVLSARASEQEFLNGLAPAELLDRCLPEFQEESGVEPSVRLLDFSVSLAPGETVRLEIRSGIQAFMERDTIFRYCTTETRYTFHYFLSPARYWDSFRNLEIELRLSGEAPVLADSSLPFRRTGWRRYVYQSDSLPEGDLQFTAVSSVWITLLRAAAALLAAAGIVLLIWGIRRKLGRRKK